MNIINCLLTTIKKKEKLKMEKNYIYNLETGKIGSRYSCYC